MATESDEGMVQAGLREAALNPSASRVTSVVCQWQGRWRACRPGSAARREATGTPKFDSRASSGAKSRDPQPSASDIVETFLLGTPVLAFAGDAEAEAVAVAGKAPGGVGDDDGGVIDSQEESLAADVPARIALARREPQDLECMAVGIFEVEGANAARVRIPVGPAAGVQAKRTRPDARADVRCAIHVAHDDGHMLKPAVVTARVKTLTHRDTSR